MSLFSLLSIARDGIVASTGAMNVAAQNVAGASTPGYVRRAPVLAQRPSGGVELAGMARSFDRFSYGRLLDQESRLAAAGSRAAVVADLEALLVPATDTLADRANALLDSFHELALHPSDLAVRTAVLSRASFLANGFSEAADGLASFKSELFTQAKEVATGVSSRLARLGDLDTGILAAEGRGDDASSLRDARDQIAREVSEQVGARVIEGPDGRITLFGPGGVLYEGGLAASLDVAQDPSGTMVIRSTRNGVTADITASVDSGALGGIREVRDADIPAAARMLDDFARDLASALNAVHEAGFGLDGVTGRPLFAPPPATGAAHAMTVDPSLLGHPERLAAAASSAELPGGNTVAAALANGASLALGAGGTLAERYGEIANMLGVARNDADAEQRMREDTVATASALRESASGVSTDEEMIRLQQFQRSFEAASKVLATVNDLFDTLMRI